METMETVNGGFSPFARVIGTILGAFIGGIAGGAVAGYVPAFLDGKGGKKQNK